MWCELINTGDWGAARIHIGKDGPPVPARPLNVQWTDGTEETLDIRLKKITNTVTVGDMGHVYTSVSEVPYVVVKHYGPGFEMPLHKTGVKAWRDK